MTQTSLTSGASFDQSEFDPTGTGTILRATATRFEYLTTSGHTVLLIGTGLTYGADPGTGPTGGDLTRIDVIAPSGDGTARNAVDLAVGDLPGDFYGEADAFWATLLSGNDLLDLGAGNPVANLFGRTLFAADGLGMGQGSAVGGRDEIRLGDTGGQFYGDFVDMGGTGSLRSDLRGGHDTITGEAGASRQTVIGDVGTVWWTETVRGGRDTITLASDATVYGDVYRQLYGGYLAGGDDVVTLTGGSGSRIYGDAYEIDDFGGAMTFRGGDDTLDAGAAGGGTTLTGDFDSAILSRADGGTGRQVVMGDDSITGSSGNDVIRGDAAFVSTTVTVRLGSDRIDGGAGDDLIHGDVASFGSGTNERLFAGGADWIDGGTGDDTVHGGHGDDTLLGGGGADDLRGGRGHDELNGGGMGDSLDGGSGSDTLLGGGGADTLRGGSGGDEMRGSLGSDRLYGMSGSDLLEGGDGNDALLGGGGADTLDGGAGRDNLRGNGGADLFVFAPGMGDDRVLDYADGTDRLDISAFGLSDGGGSQSWRGATTAATQEGDDVLILWAGGGSTTISGTQLSQLTDADFVF